MRSTVASTIAFLFLAFPVGAQETTVTSPDGKIVAKATEKTISFFDAATQKELVRILGHTGNVTALAFAPDGKFLASGGEDKGVRLWDPATGKELRRFTVGDAVEKVNFTPDGKNLTVKTKDGKSAIFDVATGQKIQ